ncbi:MAG TPA: hypothetical protein ENN08_00545 [Bacteroidales bacterium]|nr:hypothetical protein [Bacteroidales bacterium]
MKRFLYLLLTLLSVFAAFSLVMPVFGQVYLINEGFESIAPPPTGWVYTTGVTHSTDRYRTGARSARFSANDHSIRTPLLTTPEILSFWLFRPPPGQGGGVLSVQVQWHTDPNAINWNTIATLSGSNNTWIQYTTDITTNPLFTTKKDIYIRIRSNSGTRVFFIDDFTITSAAPIPDFEAVPKIAGINENIIFTDNSQGSISSWFWDFGSNANPPTANTQGPHTVNYSTAGFKTVSLMVDGAYKKTKTDYIAIATTQQSASASYVAGDIPTDYGFQSLPGKSTCPASLTVNIPPQAIISGVDVSYQMSAQNWGWMSEQRSQLRCVSTGGTSEATLAQGVGDAGGVYSYNRTGLDIANGVSGGGDIIFELHAGRTWGGSKCNTTYNKVNNKTWTVTVFYAEIPFADFIANPTIADIGQTITFTDTSGGGVFSDWNWNFGDDADPATANTQGPHDVTYSTPGYKTISLTVDGTYTETKTNYVAITDPDWLHWDDGLNFNAVGRATPGILQIAARFEPSDLLAYPSHEITRIKVYVYDLPTGASIKIWQGPDQAGLVEYVSQSFTPVANSWVIVDLDEPYQVDPALELWFGVEFQDQGDGFFPAGIDEFTVADGKSNLYRLNNNDNLSWAALTTLAVPIQGDWNVQAYLVEFIPPNPFNPPRLLSAEVINGNDVVLNWYSPEIDEGFELYTDFSLSFGNWIQYDFDEDPTWGSAAYDFPNEFYTGSFIIFNPSETTPPATDPAWQPHSGEKFAACFAANPGPNDDWLITPRLKIAEGDQLSFYHKSVTDTYGYERFRVGISTTGTNIADFLMITPSPYLESPTAWTQYTYDLSTYEDQEIYITINCVSDDAFVFMLDDFMVTDDEGKKKYALNFADSSGNSDQTNELITERQTNPGNAIPELLTPKSTQLFSSYKIYRNNIEIDQVSGFTYTDMTVPPGSYTYYVTAIYTDPAGESDSSNVVEVVIDETWIWTGAISSAWTSGDNWNTTIPPNASSNVLIPATSNDPIITTPVIVNDLHIQSGASLTVDPNGTLTVDGTLLNEQGINGLIIASSAAGTGSLIHHTGNVPATFQRYISGEPQAWHLLSSPMSNQEISGDFTPTGGSNPYGDNTRYDFYTWYEPDTSWIYLLNTEYPPTWAQAHSGNSFIPGKGYLVSYLDPNPTKTFGGLLNSGAVNINITKTTGVGAEFGANLVGNPYPSSVDWKENAGWDRNDLELSGGGFDIWIWNDIAYNYGVYNSSSASDEGTLGVTRFIAPTQGFFVRAAQNGSLAVNHQARKHVGAGNWLKGINKFTQFLHLVIESEQGGGIDEVLMEFNKPIGQSGTIKKFSFVPEAPSLYIPKNGQFYSIRFLENPEKLPVIPVAFKAGKNGDYIFRANFDPAFFEMIELHDLQNGAQQNLKENPVYRFTAKGNDNPARFVLQFVPGHYPNPHDLLPVRFWAQQNIIFVDLSLLQGQYIFQLYDLTGRLLVEKELPGEQVHVIMHELEGVYLSQIIGKQGRIARKVWLY